MYENSGADSHTNGNNGRVNNQGLDDLFSEHTQSDKHAFGDGQRTLGSIAVRSEIRRVYEITDGKKTLNPFVNFVNKKYNKKLENVRPVNLNRARKSIENTLADNKFDSYSERLGNPYQETFMNEVLQTLIIQEIDRVGLSSPNFPKLHKIYSGLSKHSEMPTITFSKGYAEALTAKNETGNYIIGDDAFMNFLEMHQYDLVQQTSRNQDLIIERKQQYCGDIARLVEKGWLNGSAEKHLDIVRDRPVFLDDGFATIFTKREANGYVHDFKHQDRRAVVIPQSDVGLWALSHEFTHLLAGQHEKIYGLRRIFGNEFLDEAVTEAITLLTKEPNLPEYDKDSPECQNLATNILYSSEGSYLEERMLLSQLLSDGEYNDIDIKTFFDAYIEDGSRRKSAQRRLIKGLKAEYPGQKIIKQLSGSKKSLDEITSSLKRPY
jgi:hypothetical protein